MTEIRFSKCKDMWKVFDWENGETLNFKEIINLLNELAEENRQCENEIARLKMINAKLKNKDYDNYTKKIQELSEENKELKEENQELLGLVQEDVESWSDEKREALCDMSNAILGDFE